MHSKHSPLLTLALAGLLALTLTACGAAHVTSDLTFRALPPAPVYAAPVQTKRPTADTPLITIAAKEKAAKDAANRRITAFLAWYNNVRKNYASGANPAQ